MTNLFMRLVREEEGQSMVEYALILALISVVAIAVLSPIGTKIKEQLNKVLTQLGGTAIT